MSGGNVLLKTEGRIVEGELSGGIVLHSEQVHAPEGDHSKPYIWPATENAWFCIYAVYGQTRPPEQSEHPFQQSERIGYLGPPTLAGRDLLGKLHGARPSWHRQTRETTVD